VLTFPSSNTGWNSTSTSWGSGGGGAWSGASNWNVFSVNCGESLNRIHLSGAHFSMAFISCGRRLFAGLSQKPTNHHRFSPASGARDDRPPRGPFAISMFHQPTDSPILAYRAKAGLHRLGRLRSRGTPLATTNKLCSDPTPSSPCFRCSFGISYTSAKSSSEGFLE
jgi:hypothetical protein